MTTSRVLIGMCALAALASCKGGGTSPDGTGTIRVLISPSSAAIAPGDTVRFSAVVAGPPGISQQVVWRSLKTDIATISTAGLVTGIAEGNAEIRAAWISDQLEFSSVEVLVTSVQIPEGGRRTVARVRRN